MKRLLIVLAVCAGLVGCGGVDRGGTRDNVIEAYEAQGVDLDSDCIDAVLDGYSDDELETIDDDETGSTPEAQEMLSKFAACVTTTT
jgi:hypothetical protein